MAIDPAALRRTRPVAHARHVIPKDGVLNELAAKDLACIAGKTATNWKHRSRTPGEACADSNVKIRALFCGLFGDLGASAGSNLSGGASTRQDRSPPAVRRRGLLDGETAAH